MTNGTSKPKHLLYRDMQIMGTFQIKSEDEYVDLYEPPSPADSSEDSVEVKVEPILSRNKRKCAEPRKVPENFGPLKKRICLKTEHCRREVDSAKDCPFRPWNVKEEHNFGVSFGFWLTDKGWSGNRLLNSIGFCFRLMLATLRTTVKSGAI